MNLTQPLLFPDMEDDASPMQLAMPVVQKNVVEPMQATAVSSPEKSAQEKLGDAILHDASVRHAFVLAKMEWNLGDDEPHKTRKISDNEFIGELDTSQCELIIAMGREHAKNPKLKSYQVLLSAVQSKNTMAQTTSDTRKKTEHTLHQ